MNTAVVKAFDARSWKDLYQVALFEPDMDKLPQLLDQAEGAIVTRARELFDAVEDNSIEEQESLEYALCNLRALERSLKRRPKSIRISNHFADLHQTSA